MLENAAVAREMKHVEKGEEGGQMGGGVYISFAVSYLKNGSRMANE
jgi:hypothetical protein